MSELSTVAPAELIMMLRQAYEADHGRSNKPPPHATWVELARLLDTDEYFRSAVIAVLQIWLAGEHPRETAEVENK